MVLYRYSAKDPTQAPKKEISFRNTSNKFSRLENGSPSGRRMAKRNPRVDSGNLRWKPFRWWCIASSSCHTDRSPPLHVEGVVSFSVLRPLRCPRLSLANRTIATWISSRERRATSGISTCTSADSRIYSLKLRSPVIYKSMVRCPYLGHIPNLGQFDWQHIISL